MLSQQKLSRGGVTIDDRGDDVTKGTRDTDTLARTAARQELVSI